MENTLVQAGIAGAVLAWFMWRFEGKWEDLRSAMDRIEAAQNRQTKAQMLLLIANSSTPDSVKQLAQELSKETDEAEMERKRLAQSRRAKSSPPP